MNIVRHRTEMVEHLRGQAELHAESRHRFLHDRPDPRRLLVRLTHRAATPGFFNFAEQEWNKTNQRYQDKSGGLTHTQLGPAMELLGRRAIALDQLVWASPSRLARTADDKVIWEFMPQIGWIWAKITGFSTIVADSRFKYAWTDQARSSTTAWTSGILSGSTSADWAMNSVEANNTGSGIKGNSIDYSSTDPPVSATLQPVRGNPIVQLYEEVAADAARYYSFAYENADQGPCS